MFLGTLPNMIKKSAPIFTPPVFILASASKGRLSLLESIGLVPDSIIPADIDETPHKNELPADFVLRLAKEKAAVVAAKNPDAYVVAADTIAAAGRRIIGKAADENEARKTLKMLSGRRHKVFTGVCVVAPQGKQSAKRVMTVVEFKRLSKQELEGYIASKQWEGKSGCYGIQSRAGGFVASINGSFSNVVGLPLVEVTQMLSGLGFKHAALSNVQDVDAAP